MAPFHFACPHCSGRFRLANPPEGQTVPCPHCGEGVTLPAWSANTPLDSSSVPADTPAGGDASRAPAPLAALDFLEEPQFPSGLRRRRKRSREVQRNVRQLTRGERVRRQRIRSLVLMFVCLIVLATVVVVISRLKSEPADPTQGESADMPS